MPESFVFQLTTSRGGRRGCPSESRTGYSYFNSRPHEEVDQIPTKPKEYEDISTHDLTKRSTEAERIPVEDSDISTHDLTKRSTFSPFCVRIGHKIFQLTTSRRGRLNYVTSTKPYMVFQLTTSRRGRRQEARKKWLRDTFQLTTSRRGRRSSAPTVERGWVHFNSRPHEEVDQFFSVAFTSPLAFQLTTSRRGRHQQNARMQTYKSISTHDLTKRST